MHHRVRPSPQGQALPFAFWRGHLECEQGAITSDMKKMARGEKQKATVSRGF